MKARREHWDTKWARVESINFSPAPLLVRYTDRLNGGRALDLACGPGRNALWLAAQGYAVDAIDISAVGLEMGRAEAQRRGLVINFIQADLDHYTLPVAACDLVAVFRFLDRCLLPDIGAALRPGGWLFYETFNLRKRAFKPEMPLDYLLQPGELEAAFAHLNVIETGHHPAQRTSFLVARAPE